MVADLTLVGLRTCDTCRAARKALEQAGHNVTFRDLRTAPPRAADWALWLDLFGADLVNRRSTTWRGLSPGMREAAPQALLSAYPALMKRPLILSSGMARLGWSRDTRAAFGL